MTAFWDWLDATPAVQFYGWLTVIAIGVAIGGHLAQWRRV